MSKTGDDAIALQLDKVRAKSRRQRRAYRSLQEAYNLMTISFSNGYRRLESRVKKQAEELDQLRHRWRPRPGYAVGLLHGHYYARKVRISQAVTIRKLTERNKELSDARLSERTYE